MTSASIVTATTIAVPLKNIFQNSDSFSSVKPSCIVATRIAPRVAPSTVPEPPKTLTPPITTAVTASNSRFVPGDRVDAREARREHEPGQTRERAADHERGEHAAATGMPA